MWNVSNKLCCGVPNDLLGGILSNLASEIDLKDVICMTTCILLMNDEAYFHLNGMVSRQHCRYWGFENPRVLHERPLHSSTVRVWCAVEKLPSLVLTLLKTMRRMLWLWTPRTTPRWSTILLSLNYDENVCRSDVCSFSRIKQRPT